LQGTNRRRTPPDSALFCSATKSRHQRADPADCCSRRGAVRPESHDHGWRRPALLVARVSRRHRRQTRLARHAGNSVSQVRERGCLCKPAHADALRGREARLMPSSSATGRPAQLRRAGSSRSIETTRTVCSTRSAPHVRVDPGRDRQGPHLRDAAARAHRPCLHAAGLLPRDAPQRGRSASGSRRWSKATIGHTLGTKRPNRLPRRQAGPRLERRKPRFSRAFLLSGRPDLNRGPHRPERCALPGCATPRIEPVSHSSAGSGRRGLGVGNAGTRHG
jgi:hypothetical protein